MNTQTHILVSAAIFAQPGASARNVAAIAGAVVPDTSIYLMYGWARLRGLNEFEIWRDIHFSAPWQDLIAATNSVPIYVAIFLMALVWALPAIGIFAASSLVHIALDFPFHHTDAHRNFWPITDWRFESQVSYWDASRWGDWISLGEAALGLALAVVLWRRFRATWVRATLAVLLAAYVAVPFYWSVVFA